MPTTPCDGLSSVFRPKPAAPSLAPKKKAKANSSEECDGAEVGEELDTEKRKTPFKRKQAVEGNLRTYKVRMLPTVAQVTELKRCFSMARLVYNKTLRRVKDGSRLNTIELRKEMIDEPLPEWAKDNKKVARSIVEAAVKQVVDAYSSNHAKQKLNPNHHFEVKYRSVRKTLTEVVRIQKDSSDPKKKHSTLLKFAPVPYTGSRPECMAFFGSNFKDVGGIRLQDGHQYVIDRMVADGTRLKEDCKIRWDKRIGTFHLIYTFEQPKLEDPDPEFQKKRIVSNDPGVEPFQAFYSPTSGQYGKLLHDGRSALRDRVLQMDKLQSRIDRRKQGSPCSSRTSRQRYTTMRRLRRKLARDRRRLYGYVEAGHYYAANFLLGQFDIVVQPELHVCDLTCKHTRNVQSKTARSMLTWSHYKYRERIKSAATRYPGRHVIECEEPGTSKTCTHCGFWNKNLQLCDKTYVCPQCHIQVDRDVAGARNNFLAKYGEVVGIGWDGDSD